MARAYKEGLGKWSRGIMVMLVVLGAVFGLSELYAQLPRMGKLSLLGFNVDYRFLITAPFFIGSLFFANWLFNRPKTADFLIDTENELKNKVTWPSQKEEVNASIVVVVTVFVLGAFVFACDAIFGVVITEWYFG